MTKKSVFTIFVLMVLLVTFPLITAGCKKKPPTTDSNEPASVSAAKTAQTFQFEIIWRGKGGDFLSVGANKVIITDRVFDGDAYGNKVDLYAMHAESGRPAWTQNVSDKQNWPLREVYGPPVIVGDSLILSCGERVKAFYIDSGWEKWSTPSGHRPASNVYPSKPVLYEDIVYVLADAHNMNDTAYSVSAIRAIDGSVLWRKQVGSECDYKIPLRAGHGLIIVPEVRSRGLVRVWALDAKTGEVKWDIEGKFLRNCLSVSDKWIFVFGDDSLICIQPTTGEEKLRLPVPGVTSCALEAGGIACVRYVSINADRSWVQHLRAFDLKTSTVRWEKSWPPSPTLGGSTLAVNDGILYVGVGGILNAIELETGTLIGTVQLSDKHSITELVFSQGLVFALCGPETYAIQSTLKSNDKRINR